MEEKEIKNGDVYGKLDFDSDEKVVFPTEVTLVKIDNRDVELPVEALEAAGWSKVNDDEQIVKKVELSEEWATFMEENKHLPFSNNGEGKLFTNAVLNAFDEIEASYREKQELFDLLAQAYFNGYTIKRETKYYIKFPLWIDESKKQDNRRYLNINEYDDWELNTKAQIRSRRTQFTQGEIDKMQEDERAKGFNLDTLKVRVPDDELED